MDSERYLTRKDLPGFLLEKRNFSISMSRLDVLKWQGIGPPVAGKWGRAPMYRPDDVLRWADERAGIGGEGGHDA